MPPFLPLSVVLRGEINASFSFLAAGICLASPSGLTIADTPASSFFFSFPLLLSPTVSESLYCLSPLFFFLRFKRDASCAGFPPPLPSLFCFLPFLVFPSSAADLHGSPVNHPFRACCPSSPPSVPAPIFEGARISPPPLRAEYAPPSSFSLFEYDRLYRVPCSPPFFLLQIGTEVLLSFFSLPAVINQSRCRLFFSFSLAENYSFAFHPPSPKRFRSPLHDRRFPSPPSPLTEKG